MGMAVENTSMAELRQQEANIKAGGVVTPEEIKVFTQNEIKVQGENTDSEFQEVMGWFASDSTDVAQRPEFDYTKADSSYQVCEKDEATVQNKKLLRKIQRRETKLEKVKTDLANGNMSNFYFQTHLLKSSLEATVFGGAGALLTEQILTALFCNTKRSNILSAIVGLVGCIAPFAINFVKSKNLNKHPYSTECKNTYLAMINYINKEQAEISKLKQEYQSLTQ